MGLKSFESIQKVSKVLKGFKNFQKFQIAYCILKVQKVSNSTSHFKSHLKGSNKQ